MTTDLFTDSPEVAELKARNKALRQRLKQQTAALESLRTALVSLHLAMEEVGEGAFHGDMLEQDERRRDSALP
jgi:predicted  nucleic acid-binding Zn-ribbon protein